MISDVGTSGIEPPPPNWMSPKILLIVPRNLVKTVKTQLEHRDHFDRNAKISSWESQEAEGPEHECFIIPTLVESTSVDSACITPGHLSDSPWLLQVTGLTAYAEKISFIISQSSGNEKLTHRMRDSLPSKTHLNASNDFSKVIGKWISSLPEEVRPLLWPPDPAERTSLLPDTSKLSYIVYPPMLLLCSNFLSAIPLHNLPRALDTYRDTLFADLCRSYMVTHIALKGKIPANVNSTHYEEALAEDVSHELNVLRCPERLITLYGDFGPQLPSMQPPQRSDLESAFWCSARQNGITQVWAPRYTMFSRGNISEKARLLRLHTLQSQTLGCSPNETSAVDLYAGIGYFTFSYAKAGVGKVLCFEINPWSVEGLRRGAEANGWMCFDVSCELGRSDENSVDSRLLIFEQSNAQASDQVNRLRSIIPPIRHINCGYLPSSEASWKTAVECLDPVTGGWIHAHENVADAAIGFREEEIVRSFLRLIDSVWGARAAHVEVCCEHVQRVKSYAPKVSHYVFDIAILPSTTDS